MTSDTELTYPDSSRGDATEHNTRAERDYPEQTNSRSRSRRPHPCITIRRAGPAFGLPATPSRATGRDFMIVAGWSWC